MEQVTIIIGCDLLPYVDAQQVKADIKKALQENSDYINSVTSVVIRKEKG